MTGSLLFSAVAILHIFIFQDTQFVIKTTPKTIKQHIEILSKQLDSQKWYNLEYVEKSEDYSINLKIHSTRASNILEKMEYCCTDGIVTITPTPKKNRTTITEK